MTFEFCAKKKTRKKKEKKKKETKNAKSEKINFVLLVVATIMKFKKTTI